MGRHHLIDTRVSSHPVTGRIVFPPRLTRSAERIRVAAHVRGLASVQLPTFEVPVGLTADHLHAGPTFADAVAPVLGIAPLEAPADWLSTLPAGLTGRRIEAMPIRDAWRLRTPAFIKSPNDKSITAMIYSDGTRLPGSDAVDPETPVLVSPLVTFTVESRLFVLDGDVHVGSRYADDGRLRLGPVPAGAAAFAADALPSIAASLPSAIVIDVGLIENGSSGRPAWVVIEANAAWASGCYAADARDVLDVVLRAAGPETAVSDHDRRFIRTGTPVI
jgi:hypothetical protein